MPRSESSGSKASRSRKSQEAMNAHLFLLQSKRLKTGLDLGGLLNPMRQIRLQLFQLRFACIDLAKAETRRLSDAIPNHPDIYNLALRLCSTCPTPWSLVDDRERHTSAKTLSCSSCVS